jgi:hypothetical protein
VIEDDTRTLSTTATHDIIKVSGLKHGFNARDVEEYHNADLETFDKLAKDFRRRYGFRLETEGDSQKELLDKSTS